jgi:type VII secretion-associated serine protease mycosin
MIYRLCLLLVLLCTILAIPTARPAAGVAAAPAASHTHAYVAGELLLKLQPGFRLSPQANVAVLQSARSTYAAAQARSLNSLLRSLGGSQSAPISPGSNTYQLIFERQEDAARLAATLDAHPAVVFAEPNYIRHSMREPNDPVLQEQWALRNIQALQAWDITTGEGIKIAVLDTGVSSSHPDLEGQVLPGHNALFGNDRAEDDNGHGTAVAGLIAARTDNGEGIAGMCWGCAILPVKVLNSRGGGSDAAVARGMRWATDAGARVINMSLGGSGDSQTLREAVEYAHSRGALVVAASGNERQSGNPINYPAAYPQVLAVSGTSNADTVTGFSNTGEHIDIAAPSVALWTTILNDNRDYGPPNGTSFSSPYVSGTAALVFTLRPDLSNDDIRCVLEASADDKGPPGKDAEYGWGRLNAFKAVQLAQNYNGCPLSQPEQPQAAPAQPGTPDAFAPVPPVPGDANQVYFPETQHTLRGEFKAYWERHGGLPIFGFPISEEFIERSDDGSEYVVQYFERHRFEFHPANSPPYHVQLSRLGATMLETQGRSWYTFPKGEPTPGCLFFEATGHTLCEPFLSYWRSNGLEFDGSAGTSYAESLALFGQPLSQPQPEEVAPGVWVTVQWFERARFEDHGSQGVLLGLLSSDLTRLRGWR